GRKTTAVSSLQEKYLAFEKRLERTTGKKRWGATTPPDAEERLSAYQSADAAVDQARSELEQARTKLDTLKQQFQDAIHSHRTRDEEGFQIAITAQQREIQNAALRL